MTLLLFLPQIQVLKPFLPSRPTFSPNLPPKCPNMMIGHAVGPHWYLYRIPGLSNMTIVTIFLNPTCQSWPQMSQISQIVQNHDFMCKIQFFSPNNSSPDRKHAYWVENSLHHPFRGSKTPFFCIKMPLFWPKKSIFEQFLALNPQNSALGAKLLLPHGISGYNLRWIWWGRFFESKKALQSHLKITILAWNSGFEAVLALLTNFFTKITPKCPQIRTGHVVGPHR